MVQDGDRDAEQSSNATTDIETLLRDRMRGFSPSEQLIAIHMIENIQTLPFESGSAISRAVGVSNMTVTRFIRSLGFENLRDLKNRMCTTVVEKHGEIESLAARFQVRDEQNRGLQESMRLELEAVAKAYQLAGSKQWDEATTLLAGVRDIYVVGFQANKGAAIDFASRLLWARPNVTFVESLTGTYQEILSADPAEAAVVFIDCAVYAERGAVLAKALVEAEIPLVIVSDRYSHWGFAYSPYVFEGYTQVKTFWDSTASINVILNLMIDSIALKLNGKAQEQFSRMERLAKRFGEYVNAHDK